MRRTRHIRFTRSLKLCWPRLVNIGADTLSKLFQPFAQADFIEGPEWKLHESQHLSLKTAKRGSQRPTSLDLVIEPHGVG